jgi:glycosyltransferase involved in cell wall biosynthesis
VASRPHISVLIPAFNEQDLLPGTIQSVRESFAAVNLPDYEIVVCDNNSTDRTAAIARAAGARVVSEPHNQIARARNTAARAAAGDWLLFLDADTELNPAALADLQQAIGSGSVGAGGSTIRMDRTAARHPARFAVHLWNLVSRVCRLAAGSFIFCRRSAWETVGGFDERCYASEEIWFSRDLKRWCRANRQRFVILNRAPIVTSARKLHWYSPAELFRQFAALIIPGAWHRRENCNTWYHRPESAE